MQSWVLKQGLPLGMSPVPIELSFPSLIDASGKYFRGKCNTALSKEIMNLTQKGFLSCAMKNKSLCLLIIPSLKQLLGFFVVKYNCLILSDTLLFS